MFNCQKYDSNDLESVLRHNVHAKSAYSAVLVDKCLNVVLSDLILHSMETINIAQAQCERETNILSRDINGFKFHENAKTWFSHILDQDESPTYEDEYF
ncbi:hypothetical protein G9P44_004380 [Scheffersomyces stipitis]|nr:hypothetical protein G9P44_004380 [Scheffersomyces stipitis]